MPIPIRSPYSPAHSIDNPIQFGLLVVTGQEKTSETLVEDVRKESLCRTVEVNETTDLTRS